MAQIAATIQSAGRPSAPGSASVGNPAFGQLLATVQDGLDAGVDPYATAPGTGGAAGADTTLFGSASGTTGSAVVADAEKYLGVPYVYGGTDPSTGLDCSALVQRTFADLGVSLPRTAAEQSQVGTPVASLAEAQPGDLVFYGSPAEHVGIYIGNGHMIDAPHTGTDVRVESVGQPTSIRRVVSPAAPATAVAKAAARYGGATGGGPAGPSNLQPLFASAAARYGVPPALLSSVAKAESGYNTSAVSPAGAQGLMQLMPSTAAGLGVNPWDPAQAINGAARLLSSYHSQFGSWPLAVAAYNAGPGAVSSHGGVPPYPETRNYVNEVMSYMGAAA
jgi:cell wall-associated NlpC family hydrolase